MPKIDWPPQYLRKRGHVLAAANKKCRGTKNDKGQFYKCVKRELVKR